MAATHYSRPLAGGHHIRGRFHRMMAAFVAWNDARATRKALSQLSDRQLDDIGLIRGDIDGIGH